MIAQLIRKYIGSVRLFMALLITVLFWALAPKTDITVPAYFVNMIAWVISETQRQTQIQ